MKPNQQLPLGPRDLMAALSTPEQQNFEFRRKSLADWLHAQRVEDSQPARDFAQLIEALGPVLNYLGGALDPNNTAIRVWCLLYIVRPELIEYESFNTAGIRFGVSDETMRIHLKTLLRAIPAYRFVARSSVGPNSPEFRRRVQRRAMLKKKHAVIDVPEHEHRAMIEQARREAAEEAA